MTRIFDGADEMFLPRRHLLQGAASLGVAGVLGLLVSGCATQSATDRPQSS